MNKYLPSKQFITRVIILVVLIVIAISVYNIGSFIKGKFGTKNPTALVVKPEVIQKDTNNNGIPDWEESLWGLNPSSDGVANKEFIMAKREALARENGGGTTENQQLSENETLSREFFSIIMSLQESGNLDETSMKSIGDTIGQKITATPLKDIYNMSMLSTIKANPATTNTYFDKLSVLINSYKNKDIGKELTFISVGLTHSDPQALDEAKDAADAYRSFGKDLMKIQVPNTLSLTHLSLANNYEKVAESIDDMSIMLDDPIAGMKAIINYKKYTDGIVTDINTLSKNLQ